MYRLLHIYTIKSRTLDFVIKILQHTTGLSKIQLSLPLDSQMILLITRSVAEIQWSTNTAESIADSGLDHQKVTTQKSTQRASDGD
jgi:hypothetical protein